MVEGIGPATMSSLEKIRPNIACPNCSWPMAEEINRDGTEAEQLANIAAYVTVEMTQLLVRLQEIMEGFKQAVENGGQAVDGELGIFLGGILSSVAQVREQMEKVSSCAVAMSSARLAQMTESLRLDMRSLMQAKSTQRKPD